MTPAPPPSVDPSTAHAVNEVIEYGGKAAVSLVGIWSFVQLIAKPWMDWRRRRMIELMREAFEPQMDRLYNELDEVLDVALDLRDWRDDYNDFLSGIGFSANDQRDPERQKEIGEMIVGLQQRRKERDRKRPMLRNP